MDKYIIINESKLQKRIEELKYQRELAGNLFEEREYNLNDISSEIRILEKILSQSTPLIPENIDKILSTSLGSEEK